MRRWLTIAMAGTLGLAAGFLMERGASLLGGEASALIDQASDVWQTPGGQPSQ